MSSDLLETFWMTLSKRIKFESLLAAIRMNGMIARPTCTMGQIPWTKIDNASDIILFC